MSHKAQIDAVRAKVDAAIKQGAREGMEAVRTAAIPLTPKAETGNLRGGFVIGPAMQQAQITSIILGNTMVYARYQHEGYGFNFTTPGTGAGYLKRAGEENADKVKAIIANHIKGAL